MCPTPCGCNIILTGSLGLLYTENQRFPVIFDSGASIAISGFNSDFVGEIVRSY